MMQRHELIAIGVQLLLLICTVEASKRKDVHIVFNEITCKVMSKKVQSANCHVSSVNNVSGITTAIQLNEDVPQVQLEVLIKIGFAGNRTVTLPNLKLDLCQILEKPSRRSFLQLFYNNLKKSAVNIPMQCPYKQNITYGTNNLVLDSGILPFPISYARIDAVAAITGVKNAPLVNMFVRGTLCQNHADCSHK